ncbi:MAG: helix-turn-helix domain-containing protein [Rhizomicrobium sp.]
MSYGFDLDFSVDCPGRKILDQIADKWSMMALFVLKEPKRFNAIKRRLSGITQRVLTQTLRKLERNGMVSRRIISGPTLGVEYSLTPLGRSLEERLRRCIFGPSQIWARSRTLSRATI